MSRQVGAVSWETQGSGGSSEDKKPVPFLKMEKYNSTHTMRVVSAQPMQYHCHWVEGSSGGKVKVNCTLDETCPVVDEKTNQKCMGRLAQTRWYVKVIDRADGQVKVLDIGPQIFNQIAELHSTSWGSSTQYDISIKKGTKGSSPLYNVTPLPKETLSEADAALVVASETEGTDDFIDLTARCKGLTAEVINKIVNGDNSPAPRQARAGREASKTTTPPATTQLEEDSEDFLDWGEDE